MNDYDVILEFISEVQDTLAQLLSSGFFAAHEFTINELKRLEKSAKIYNLTYAEEILGFLYEKLESKKHTFKFDYSECIDKYCKLNNYCLICIEQLEILNIKGKYVANIRPKL